MLKQLNELECLKVAAHFIPVRRVYCVTKLPYNLLKPKFCLNIHVIWHSNFFSLNYYHQDRFPTGSSIPWDINQLPKETELCGRCRPSWHHQANDRVFMTWLRTTLRSYLKRHLFKQVLYHGISDINTSNPTFRNIISSARVTGTVQMRYRVPGSWGNWIKGRNFLSVEVWHWLPLHPELEALFDDFSYQKEYNFLLRMSLLLTTSFKQVISWKLPAKALGRQTNNLRNHSWLSVYLST